MKSSCFIFLHILVFVSFSLFYPAIKITSSLSIDEFFSNPSTRFRNISNVKQRRINFDDPLIQQRTAVLCRKTNIPALLFVIDRKPVESFSRFYERFGLETRFPANSGISIHPEVFFFNEKHQNNFPPHSILLLCYLSLARAEIHTRR